MIFNCKKSSLLCKIFPLELPCSTFRHVRGKDQKTDEKSETKEPSSSNLSSSDYQISPSKRRMPIEVFQVPASFGDGHFEVENDATPEQEEARSSLTSFCPAVSKEATRKWMAFDSENFDVTKTYTKNLSRSFGSYSIELLEKIMTERTVEENNSGLLSLQLTYVISDATKPDCPIVFASDMFLVMIGYTMEEVIGRNCRFLQGPGTDKKEVAKIRDAIIRGNSYCGKLLNYKKNGTPFWNLLTVGPVKDSHGNIIKFIGMQVEIGKNTEEKEKTMRSMSITEVQAVKGLRSYIQSKRHDAYRKHEEPETTDIDYALHKAVDDENICTPNNQKAQIDLINGLQDSSTESGLSGLVSSKRFKERTLGSAVEREEKTVVEISVLKPKKPKNLWSIYCQPVIPRPHKKYNSSWTAIQKITSHGEKIGLHHFKPLKPLGFGDIGSVHLVELKGTCELFAMKAIEKSVILKRNKVHRACMEREIVSLLDHPFMPTLYSSFQTPTHIVLIIDFCPGGELFAFLDKQPMKMFKEEAARFYAAEVVIALEYLHFLGIIYRDLKPENILLQKDGHIVLTDFDLSFKTSNIQTIESPPSKKTKRSRRKLLPVFVVEPVVELNSFIGTDEYIAPEIIIGADHSSSIDWWTLGVLLYEMLYGRTPFKGKNRKKTFANILFKDLTFPFSIQVSLAAKQLIDALLQRDPARRLGSRTGADEIKRHPFFRQIDWPKIRTMTPPSSEAALQLIERDPKANDLKWEDHGVLRHSSIGTDFF